MTTTTTTTAYIAAATNRFPHAAHASKSSLVALGSGKLISLWDVTDGSDRGILKTIPGHEGLVTCVRFISEDTFASADDKGVLLLWRRVEDLWSFTVKVQAHAKAISSLCILGDYVVTGSSDASVKIWNLSSDSSGKDTFLETQTLSLGGRYPLALALAHLPKSSAVILAVAETDRNIHLWVRSEIKFVHASVLSGHEDWVKALDFCAPGAEDQPLILASGSQDATIRLWNVERVVKHTPDSTQGDDLLDAFEASLGDVGEAEEGGRQISLKRHILTVKTDSENSQRFSVTFDALLIGHDAGITSLAWRPTLSSSSAPTLFSTSTDSSVILWSPSSLKLAAGARAASLWINRQRFGDIGGQRLGGFVGGLWADNGTNALAWGWSGGWRRWTCRTSARDVNEENWSESGAISGHSGPVKGLDWCPNGDYLISTGVDQTTRIHGAIPSKTGGTVWHEVSRPQVHGYDLIDAAFLDPLKFVSIADEKVTRVFEAPRGFVELTESLGMTKFDAKEHERPAAANVPPLGLSNKATQEAPSQELGQDSFLTRRPFEGDLAQITLWPEIEKIFGHGYESISLTVSPKKTMIATACKASTPEHAVVRLYDAASYQLIGQPLGGHSLTVTRITFSPDESHILSVSRDRSWRLFKREDGEGYTPVAADKSHGRIIWDCAWTAEGDCFMTASRDKTVRVWHEDGENSWKAVETIKTDTAATALAISPGYDSRRRVAIGLETGEILIYSNVSTAVQGWKHDFTIPSSLTHIDQIHRLSWQPTTEAPTSLASCSEDGTIRVLIVPIAVT